MNQSDLRRFAPLYHYARYFGADRILRRYVGLPDDYVIPLGLAHGVDLGLVSPCQDVLSAEPIHWAHNERVYRAALTVKAAVKLPHPVLLAIAGKPRRLGKGTLVVGPPPGPVNDQRLLDILGLANRADTTILVKPKRHFERSIQFWQGKGFNAVTLADRGEPSYDRIVELFSDYDRIVGCTFSSAIVFGAAMGMDVELLKDFYCRTYETTEVAQCYSSRWDLAAEIVRPFANSNRAETTAVANQLLGSELLFEPAEIRALLDLSIKELTEPVHFHAAYRPTMRRLVAEIAALTNQPGLLQYRLPELLRRRYRQYVYEHEANEVDAFLNGASDANLQLKKIRYVPGRTIPGDAIEPYCG